MSDQNVSQFVVLLKSSAADNHFLLDFRPPMGDIDDRVRAIAKAMGLIPVLWNLDSRDWSWDGQSNFTALTDTFSASLKTVAPGTPGKLILEHDFKNTTLFLAPYFLNATIKAKVNPVSVAVCRNDSYPHLAPVVPPPSWTSLPAPDPVDSSTTIVDPTDPWAATKAVVDPKSTAKINNSPLTSGIGGISTFLAGLVALL